MFDFCGWDCLLTTFCGMSFMSGFVGLLLFTLGLTLAVWVYLSRICEGDFVSLFYCGLFR